MLDRLLSFTAPHSCCSCGEIGALLCEMCKNDIIHERFEQCIGCLRPSTKALCSSCSRHLGVDQAWCIGERRGALKCLLDAYKFRSSKEAARHIAELLGATLPVLTDTQLVAVPSAPQHVRVRGFDHVAMFTGRLSKARSLPCLQPLENTSNDIQHFKSRRERLEAAERSIRLTGAVSGRILLIDDIMTTGATISVCAKRLSEAGASEVDVAIVARQMLD